MAEATGISWADATMNPWVGCTKVSTECKFCYAETLVTGRMGRPGTWGPRGTRERTSPSLWKKPELWNRRAAEGLLPDGKENRDGHRPRVFCASLADVFEPRPELVPWRDELFALIEETPNLDWLVLTKRPEEARDWLLGWWAERRSMRMETRNGGGVWTAEGRTWTTRDYLGWGCLPNLWVGTSIGDPRYTWRADALREIPAAVRFLSCEPLVASLYPKDVLSRTKDSRPLVQSVPAGQTVDDDATEGGTPTRERAALDLTGIDWVIVGGESGGRNARPMHPDWAREIRDAVLGLSTIPCPACYDVRGACPSGLAAVPGSGMPPGSECQSVGPPPPDSYPWGRPAFHFKQWGSWKPEENESHRLGDPALRWVCDMPRPSELMRYAGVVPTSGGKLLDGVTWQEFPTHAGVTGA